MNKLKHLRNQKILELIKENIIETQEELQQQLKECGYEVTQATVSRDIKKLRLFKTLDENGKYRYTAANNDDNSSKVDSILSSAIIKIDYAMNDVVIKCRTGMAMAACATLDAMEFELIVGTLAGDDTIFVVTRSADAAAEFCKHLSELIK